MKKIFKILSGTALVLTVACASVNAEWVQSGDDAVTLTYELGEDYTNKSITVDVFVGADTTAEDLLSAPTSERVGMIVTRTQDVTNSDGSYTFTFKIAGDSGKYASYASVEGKNDYIHDEIDFVNIAQFQSAVSALNTKMGELDLDNPDYQPLFSVISDNKSTFGLTAEKYENFDQLNGANIAEILSKLPENGVFDAADREGVINMVQKAVFVEMLNCSMVEDVFSDLTLSELNIGVLADWYDAEFVANNNELKTDMTNRLSNRTFKSYDDYKNAVLESFILAVVKNPDGYLNAASVCTAFQNEIGISVESNISDQVWINLAGSDCANYPALRTAYSNAKPSNNLGNTPDTPQKPSLNAPTGNVSSPVQNVYVPEPIKQSVFSDLSADHWAKDVIEALAKDCIISGTGDNTFEPDRPIKREEFVKLIVGCIESDGSADVDFADVDKNAWYYEYIKKAVQSGLVGGYSDTSFGIGDNITRQDLATICYRVKKITSGVNHGVSGALFADDDKIAEYAKEGIYALRDAGIISGMPNNEFCPGESATRAQAAAIIYNLLYN